MFGRGGQLLVGAVVELHAAVVVLVLELQQARLLPVLHPFRTLVVHQRGGFGAVRVEGFDQVQARHGGQRGHRGVEQRNEHQRPGCRPAGITDVGHSEEADDHVRQTGRSHHQRHGEQEHVPLVADVGGVILEAQVADDFVQLRQQRHAGCGVGAEQAGLWQEVASHHHRQVGRRDSEGQDQHDVLRHLRVGHALHAAEHRVSKHDDGGNNQAGIGLDLQEACERHAGTSHLPDHVGERNDDQAQHGDDARALAGVALADEVGHRVGTEAAQVGGQQGRQQHVAAGPAHDEGRVDVANRDETRHRDEGSR